MIKTPLTQRLKHCFSDCPKDIEKSRNEEAEEEHREKSEVVDVSKETETREYHSEDSEDEDDDDDNFMDYEGRTVTAKGEEVQ